ncbi:unnamed protein product [Coregonus sp. 'balchen']|nr:unnamed protein product [Coregonus sp. 'balchen']
MKDGTLRPIVSQSVQTESMPLGESVTLEWFSTVDSVLSWIWLKHTPGHGLVPIVTTYYEKVQFQQDFANTSRFELQKDDFSFNLTLWNVAHAYVGSYHCGIFWYN